jgi:hypothetical protein
MVLISVMSVLCTAGVAFYVRFLLALCKECKPKLTGYWMFLRLASSEGNLIVLPLLEEPVKRAA